MSRRIILEGDTIDHGGEVVCNASGDRIDGRAIACMGDAVVCRRHGHTRIAEGCAHASIDGRPIALEGHRTECGACLIASGAASIG